MAVTDELGNKVVERDFSPFGERINTDIYDETNRDIDEDDSGFTGKDWDEDVGLYYYNARWYDPEIGRFTTEDSVADDPNLYGYCRQNSVNMVDPTGHAAAQPGGFKITYANPSTNPLGFVSATVNAIATLSGDSNLSNAMSVFNLFIAVKDKFFKPKKAEGDKKAADNNQPVKDPVEENSNGTGETSDSSMNGEVIYCSLSQTEPVQNLDEQDNAILSREDKAAMLALKLVYTKCQAIGDKAGMDSVMRAMVKIRQQPKYRTLYTSKDSNGVYLDNYNYNSNKITTITNVYVTEITNKNEWIEGTKGLYVASYLGGFAKSIYGFLIDNIFSAADPAKHDLRVFSGEGFKELSSSIIGEIDSTKLWDSAQFVKNLKDPTITVGDFKIVVNSTTNKGLTTTTTTSYIKADFKTIYTYSPQVVQIQGSYWRQKTMKEWQFD